MKIRTLLTVTAILSSALGAVVVYFVLTVPNDLEAGAMLRQAHTDLKAGKTNAARATLSKIVQQYPRTDAAAAATVALVSLAESERQKLERALDMLRRQNQQQAQLLAAVQKSVEEIKSAPPKVVTVTKPAPKKPAPKKKSPPRRRRR
jgi:predicted negative regulator of RcsB-dependent stress response